MARLPGGGQFAIGGEKTGLGGPRQQDQSLPGAEEAAQSDRGFTRCQGPEGVEFGVHGQSEGGGRELDRKVALAAFQVDEDPDGRALDGVDHHRYRQREGRPQLDLADPPGDLVPRLGRCGLHLGQGESRGAGAGGPGREVVPEVLPADRLEGTAQVCVAGGAELVVGIEAPEPRDEGRVAQLEAQVVEEHGRLAVADRLAGLAVAPAELVEREVPFGSDMVRVGLEAVAAVGRPLALPLLQQMVCEIGGETLAPVAGARIDIDAVAPPVVQHLVGVGGGDDEGQAQDLRPEQGEGGHAVAGLPEVLHQGELGIGIGTDQPAVEVQILAGGGEVVGRQPVIGCAQPHLGLGPGRPLGRTLIRRVDPGGAIEPEGGGHQIDIVLGPGLGPGGTGEALPVRPGPL